MDNKGQFYLGILIVVIGLLLLIGQVTAIPIGRFFWPLLLIGAGIWLLLRPQMVGPDTAFTAKVLGDVRRDGNWMVGNEEIWLGIGDVKLDMSHAQVPVGESELGINGLIGDVYLVLPEEVGIMAVATGLVADCTFLGQKGEHFATTTRLLSENYETAERRIRLKTTFFITDLTVKWA